MTEGIILILIGVFTLVCSIAKPNFYWNSRKANRMRKFVGDGMTTIIYLVLSILSIVVGIGMSLS